MPQSQLGKCYLFVSAFIEYVTQGNSKVISEL